MSGFLRRYHLAAVTFVIATQLAACAPAMTATTTTAAQLLSPASADLLGCSSSSNQVFEYDSGAQVWTALRKLTVWDPASDTVDTNRVVVGCDGLTFSSGAANTVLAAVRILDVTQGKSGAAIAELNLASGHLTVLEWDAAASSSSSTTSSRSLISADDSTAWFSDVTDNVLSIQRLKLNGEGVTKQCRLPAHAKTLTTVSRCGVEDPEVEADVLRVTFDEGLWSVRVSSITDCEFETDATATLPDLPDEPVAISAPPSTCDTNTLVVLLKNGAIFDVSLDTGVAIARPVEAMPLLPLTSLGWRPHTPLCHAACMWNQCTIQEDPSPSDCTGGCAAGWVESPVGGCVVSHTVTYRFMHGEQESCHDDAETIQDVTDAVIEELQQLAGLELTEDMVAVDVVCKPDDVHVSVVVTHITADAALAIEDQGAALEYCTAVKAFKTSSFATQLGAACHSSCETCSLPHAPTACVSCPAGHVMVLDNRCVMAQQVAASAVDGPELVTQVSGGASFTPGDRLVWTMTARLPPGNSLIFVKLQEASIANTQKHVHYLLHGAHVTATGVANNVEALPQTHPNHATLVTTIVGGSPLTDPVFETQYKEYLLAGTAQVSYVSHAEGVVREATLTTAIVVRVDVESDEGHTGLSSPTPESRRLSTHTTSSGASPSSHTSTSSSTGLHPLALLAAGGGACGIMAAVFGLAVWQWRMELHAQPSQSKPRKIIGVSSTTVFHPPAPRNLFPGPSSVIGNTPGLPTETTRGTTPFRPVSV